MLDTNVAKDMIIFNSNPNDEELFVNVCERTANQNKVVLERIAQQRKVFAYRWATNDAHLFGKDDKWVASRQQELIDSSLSTTALYMQSYT